MTIVQSIHAEWLKTKRSTATWLCIVGGFFIPLIFFIGYLKDRHTIDMYETDGNVWTYHFFQEWQYMIAFLLPMGLILATSLITQVEFRNNTWKLVNTTPQSYRQIFSAKFITVLRMTGLFFAYFTIGLILSAILPSLFFTGKLPAASFPWEQYLSGTGKIFLTTLPILALQFLLSMHFKNFLVPIGVGFLILVGALIVVGSWKYAYTIPYAYGLFALRGDSAEVDSMHIYHWSVGYGIFFIAAGYALFYFGKDKG